MTITNTASYVEYSGDDATQVFDFSSGGQGIYISDSSEITVTLTEGETITPQVLNTHYTLSGVPGDAVQVTMLTAPTSDPAQTLRLERNTPVTQSVDFSQSGQFTRANILAAFDKLTRVAQDLSRGILGSGGQASNFHPLTLKADGETWDGESKVLEDLSPGVASTDAATVAQLSDTLSISGLALVANSVTSNSIGTGSKTFTIDEDDRSSFTVTPYMIVIDTADDANYMIGRLTSYNSTTGVLVLNVVKTGGSGTKTSWEIGFSTHDSFFDLLGDTSPQLGGPLDTFSQQVQESIGTTIASAATITIPTDGQFFTVTGTTSIATINALKTGVAVWLTFAASLTLTHGANLKCPGDVSLSVDAGDFVLIRETASGVWEVLLWFPAEGLEPVDADIMRGDTDETINANMAFDPNDVSSSSGAVTFDFSASNINKISLTENITSITITAPLHGSVCEIWFRTGTGGYTITGWPAAVIGTIPTITTDASKWVRWSVAFDGDTTEYAISEIGTY